MILCLLCVLLLAGCNKGPRIEPISSLTPVRTPRPSEAPTQTPTPIALPTQRVTEEGTTVKTRFNPSTGYTRQQADPGTFSDYLQSLPLMAAGSQVVALDDSVRAQDDYDAVVSIEPLDKFEYGAGAMAHLRALYFYNKQEYTKIAFSLDDQFSFTFDKWRQGNTLRFNDSGKSEWTTGGTADDGEENFHKYLVKYYAFSGYKSLMRDLTEVDVTDPVRVGDIFVVPVESSGRLIIVVDCATDELGARQVILAEGDKPAQPLRILKNPLDSALSPWFDVDTTNGLIPLGGDVSLRLEPYADGTPARVKFLTDSTSL
jgi:hypothetical protein